MSSALQSPPPFVAPGPRPDERLVDEQIRRIRRSLKLVDFFSGVLTLVIGVLLFLLFASVMEHWVIPGGWTSTGRTLLFVTMLVGIAWYCWRTFWPLVSRTINPAYAAQLIERSTPSLKNSVLNFLLLRNRRQQLSQKVYEAIEHQAALGLTHASVDAAVDRSVLLRLGYVLVAVVAICAAYRVLSPKNLTASIERLLLPWSDIAVPARVEILKVTPGDAEIARGESLEVSAEVMGLREDETVRVRYSTLDNQTVDREVTLTGSEGSPRFQGRLPDRFSAGDNGGIQQDLEYWIEAGDAKSEKYRVTVFSRPTLVVEKIRYQFPRYTGLPPREVEGTGDVNALEGTQVSIYALANHDIASANVDFNADGRHDLPMSADKMNATAQFTLELQDDRRSPKYDSYVLQYKTTNGRSSSLPPKYSIDVTPDYAPEVKIIAPVDEEGKLVEQLDVPMDTPFTVEVEARDPDFALQQVVLLGEVGRKEVLKHDLLTKEQSGKFVGRMSTTPQELNLKVGDVMDYSVAAVDNREPEPNITRTDKLRIRVVGPPQFGERPQGQQQPGEGQQGGESGEGGQGQDGMQGPGEAGNSGEGEQQQGQGQAGGEGEQQQQGQGDSAGEQQGEGGQGNNDSEQQGENTGDNGEQQGQQQPGQQGDNQSGGEQQQGEPQSSNNSAADGENGGAQGNQQQQGGSDQGKVSAEGDQDGEAFDKMTEHFAEQDAESQGQGQASKTGGQTKQSESQNGNKSSQGDGQGSPEDQQSTAEKGQNQDEGIDGAQEGEESDGSGAEGQPNEQREQQQSDAEHGDKGEQEKTPGGEMSTEQGEQGAGNNPGENEGSMNTEGDRKARDKTDKGAPESELNDQEAPGQSRSQQENDSKGSQGGDRSGGGQEGAGQQADAEGTGTAGENTAADDGGGQAAEQGAGENSSEAGQQGASDKPTGESSETKAGEGSKQSEQSGGTKAGGEQAGEPASAGGEEQNQGEPASESGEQQNPGEPSVSEDSAAGGEPKQDEPGSNEGKQSPESQQAQESSQSGPPTGQPGAQSPSGSTGGNPSTPPPPGELEPGDAANLDYAKKQTDLVLDRLEEQLDKQEVDKKLLEKLGWTEDELRRFLERWKSLKAEAEAAPSEETKQQLDNALRSLGLNPNRRTGYQSNVTKDKLRQLQDSYRGQIPLEYADQVRAYIKGTATVPEEKAE